MAQPEIQRYSIHWTDSAFKYKRGKWVLWKDVAPYIKESRPTVRPKRAVQQRKLEIPHLCSECSVLNSSRCGFVHGDYDCKQRLAHYFGRC